MPMLAQNDQSYTTAQAMDGIRQKISRIKIDESNKQTLTKTLTETLTEINTQIKESLKKLNPPTPIIQEDNNAPVDNPQPLDQDLTIDERQTLKQKLQAMCESLQWYRLKKEQYQQLHEQIEKLNNRLNATLTNLQQNANNENTSLQSILQYIDDVAFVFRRVDSKLYGTTNVLQKLAKLTEQISQPDSIIPQAGEFVIPDINDYQVTLDGLDRDIQKFQTDLISQCLKSKNMDITVELLKNGDLPLSVCSQLLSQESWFSRKILSIFTKSACLQSRINAQDLMLFVNYETNKCIAINPDNDLDEDGQLKPEIKQKLQEICPQGLPNTVFAPSGSDYHKAIPETGTGQHVILSNMPHSWFWATKNGSAQRAEKYQKVLNQLTSINKTLVSGHKDGCFVATKIAKQLTEKGHDILGLKLIEPDQPNHLLGSTEQDIDDEININNFVEVVVKYKQNPANNATQVQQPQANNEPQYYVDPYNFRTTVTISNKTSDDVIKEQYNSTGTLLTIPDVKEKDNKEDKKDENNNVSKNNSIKKAYKYTKYRIFYRSDFPDVLHNYEQIIVNPETNNYVRVSYPFGTNLADNTFLSQIPQGANVQISTPPKSLLENIPQGTSFEICTRVQQENEINNQQPIPQDNQDNWEDVINFMISTYTNHSPKQLNLKFNYKNLEDDTLRDVIFTPKEIKDGKQEKKRQQELKRHEEEEQQKEEEEKRKKEEELRKKQEEERKKKEQEEQLKKEEEKKQEEEQRKKEEERRKENAKNNITTINNVVKKENSNIKEENKEEKNNADQMNKERENNQANKENKNIPDNAKANEENENNLQENNQEENDIQFTQILQEDNQNNRLPNKPKEKNNTNDDKNRFIPIDSSSESEDQKQEDQKQEEIKPEEKNNSNILLLKRNTNQNTLVHELKKNKGGNNKGQATGKNKFPNTLYNTFYNKLALAGNDIVKNINNDIVKNINKKDDNNQIFKYNIRSSYNDQNNQNLGKKKNGLTNSVNSERFTTKDNRANKKGGAGRQNGLISLNHKKKKSFKFK